MEVRFCITTTPRSRSGLLHPPAASFADSWKPVRAWPPPRGGGNDERGKSPNPRTGFPSFLESANPRFPHSHRTATAAVLASTPNQNHNHGLRYSLPSRLTHRFLGGGNLFKNCFGSRERELLLRGEEKHGGGGPAHLLR